MMHLDDDPPTGGGGGGDDPVLEETPGGGGGGSTQGGFGEYIAMRNEMQQSVFGDGTVFSFAYSLPTFPEQPGIVVASNDYQMMTVEILSLSPLALDGAAAQALNEASIRGMTSLRASILIGEGIGPDGRRFPFEGVVTGWTMPDGSQVNRVVPALKTEPFDDGRTFDPYLRSSPRGVVTGPLDHDRDYGPPYTAATCAALTVPNEVCVCLAQNAFDLCAWQAQQAKKVCQHTAAWSLVVALIGCVGSALGFWTVFVCLAAVAIAAKQYSDCDKNYRIAMRGCYGAFELAVVPCGVLIVHMR
jgi:hypothetical protein